MFGAAAPTSVGAASGAGDWVVLCQALRDTNGDGRLHVEVLEHGELEGDSLDTYFIARGTAPLRIDRFVGADPSGRHIVFAQGENLWLRDTQSSRQVDLAALGADTPDDARSYSPHRALSFHPLVSQLAYLRRDGARAQLVVRDLESGREQAFDPGPGVIGRLAFEPDGQFLRLDVVTQDSNRNGRLDWPFPRAKNKRGPCPGPIPRYDVWQFPGDTASVRLVNLATGKRFEPDGFVMTLGGAVLSRNAQRELWLELENGERRNVSTSTCNGRVLHADANRQLVTFGCAGAYGARRDLFLRTRTQRQRLGIEIAGFELDTRFPERPDLLALYPRDASTLLDLDTGRVHPLEPETRVLSIFGKTALTERAKRLAFVSVEPSTAANALATIATGHTRSPLAAFVKQGRFFALGRDLYDLGERRHLGRFGKVPLALSFDGRGLIPAQTADPRRLAQGPLRWEPASSP